MSCAGPANCRPSVEKYYSDLAERASDALGNVALVQSFARIEAEVMGLRMVVERLLGAQMPVLSWWAIMTVLTRASTTITLLAIFIVGTWLFFQGLTTIGEIVMFMSFATMLVARLEQVAGFINSVFMVAPRLQEFFDVLDTVPEVRDAPNAIDPGRLTGRVEFDNVSFSYDGKRRRHRRSLLHRPARRSDRARRPDRRRQDHRARACCIACSIRNPAASPSTISICAR